MSVFFGAALLAKPPQGLYRITASPCVSTSKRRSRASTPGSRRSTEHFPRVVQCAQKFRLLAVPAIDAHPFKSQASGAGGASLRLRPATLAGEAGGGSLHDVQRMPALGHGLAVVSGNPGPVASGGILDPGFRQIQPHVDRHMVPSVRQDGNHGHLAIVDLAQAPGPLARNADPSSRRRYPSYCSRSAEVSRSGQTVVAPTAANAAILALSKDGLPIKQIVRRTGHSRNLVRHVVRGERTDVFRVRQSSLEAHLPLLDEQWTAGCRNGAELWRRLKALGFRGPRVSSSSGRPDAAERRRPAISNCTRSLPQERSPGVNAGLIPG